MSGWRRTHSAHEGPPAGGRTRSFGAARRHSALVRTLKIVIPIGSLAAVGVVAFASIFNPFSRVPGLTVGPISISGSKIAMESPRLTGFRKDRRPYEVTATTAYQDVRKPNVIELKDMKGRLATDDAGGSANLVSKVGIFDTGKDHLDLSQDVRVWTEKGDEILLRSASIDLKAGTVTTRDPVKVRTPTMTLEADAMDLSDNGKAVVFTGRVRAVLQRGLESDGAAAAEKAAAMPTITQAEAGERR